MAEHADRRVRRTRDTLHKALIELMIERGYDKVSVSDIIARADVGRSTFYAHYRDKDDLLLVSCTEYLRREITRAAVPGSVLAPLRVMFHLAAHYPGVYQPLVGPKASATVLRSYRRSCAELIGEIVGEQPAGTIAFLSWGMVGLLAEMIDPAEPLSPGQAWQRFETLALPALSRSEHAGPATADDAAPPARQ
ncbi:TetR/AcrR family transcriptional regulator [Nocardia sp. NPDC059177]|uniref:TetR/AcrR family transcriptional regulator n=1 Tax=Nocardia sp. NPDC059177 TaxID=3346759 RepID=UPI003687C294